MYLTIERKLQTVWSEFSEPWRICRILLYEAHCTVWPTHSTFDSPIGRTGLLNVATRKLSTTPTTPHLGFEIPMYILGNESYRRKDLMICLTGTGRGLFEGKKIEEKELSPLSLYCIIESGCAFQCYHSNSRSISLQVVSSENKVKNRIGLGLWRWIYLFF
jgi:hypothetical protein